MTDTEIIRWQTEPDGVVVLTMDDPAQSANTLSERFVAALGDTVARLREEREHIAGGGAHLGEEDVLRRR